VQHSYPNTVVAGPTDWTQHAIPFLILLIFWLAIVFASFGLFAPANPTAIIALLLCAVAVSGEIVLIEELDNPLTGFIQIPADPMRKALTEIEGSD
jgi:hypothetical protein